MNRLVTGNLSLVTGDFQKLIPSVTLFSISSYQLPVTSYQSKRFMVPGRGAMAIEPSHEPGDSDRAVSRVQRFTIYDLRFTSFRWSDGGFMRFARPAICAARRGAALVHRTWTRLGLLLRANTLCVLKRSFQSSVRDSG